jgi:hypothetical protein
MSQTQLLLLLIAAAAIGIVAAFIMLRRQRRDREAATRESPFAVSTEGQKRCPNCGTANAWTDRTCVACRGPLAG